MIAENRPQTIPEDVALGIRKAMAQIQFVERTYGIEVVSGADAMQHDLALMAAHADLRQIDLDLIGQDRQIVASMSIRLTGRPATNGTGVDSARGIELPLLARREVAAGRLVVHQNGLQKRYETHLQLAWSAAEQLQSRDSDVIESEHTPKITGGRQNSTFRVSKEFRHNLVVTRTGRRGFLMARDLTLGRDGVFVHLKFVQPAGWIPTVGARLSALVIQTPVGLQGRAVRVC